MNLLRVDLVGGDAAVASGDLLRPENRRRRADAALWCDTLPACFRSEAFAEDLTRAPGDANNPRRHVGMVGARAKVSSARIVEILAVTGKLWSCRTT